jgi:hypothetical protein
MTFEEGLYKALYLLATEAHLVIQYDMDVFLSSVFISSEFTAAGYTKTSGDEANLVQLNRVHEIRSEIEKIQITLTSEHKDINQFSAESGNYRRIFSAVQARNRTVSELEKIAKDASLLDVEFIRAEGV